MHASRVEWTPDASDTTGRPTDPLATAGEHVTNPSTPVVTLFHGDREVTAVCVTWRRLERLDEPMARRCEHVADLGVHVDYQSIGYEI